MLTYNIKSSLNNGTLYGPCIAITNENSFFITSSSKRIKVWDFLEKKLIREFPGHNTTINKIIISGDNNYLVSVSNEVMIWNLPEKREEQILQISPNSIIISNDNQYLFLWTDNIKVWNMIENKYEAELKKYYKDNINSIAVTSNNKILASGSDDKTVRILNLSTKQEEFVFKGHRSKSKKIQ